MITSSLLVLLAVYLNKDDVKMLALTLIVAASYFLPVEYITNRTAWYSTVVIAEMIVIISALALRTRASLVIVIICAMLEINHLSAILFGGHYGSPYEIVIKSLEYIELAACCLFSEPVIKKLKGAACRVLKR